MPVFASAPRIIKEGLIFPYLAGADFVRWFTEQYPDTVPFGPRLPTSTEHIMRPDQYGDGDAPISLQFVEADDAVYTDDLGQFETEILLTDWSGSESVAARGAFGWGGDRYAVFPVGDEHALVWWTVWDDERAAERFLGIVRDNLPDLQASGWSHVVRRADQGTLPGVVFAYFPADWDRSESLPGVTLR